MYKMVQLNGWWYVKTETGKLLGAMLNKNEATKLLKHLQQVDLECQDIPAEEKEAAE